MSLQKQYLNGFTLIEMLIALFIGLTVCAMVAGALQEMSAVSLRLRQRSLAEDEARSLTEYLLSRIRMAGGFALKPYHALWVINATDGPDQLILATPREMNKTCTIEQLQSTTSGFIVDAPIQTIEGVDICCLNNDYGTATLALLSNDDDAQSHWVYGIISSIDTINCSATLSSAGVDALEEPSQNDNVFEGGTMLAVDLQIYALDVSTHRLFLSQDLDEDGVRESYAIADRVFDFQAALGYDTPSWDWRIDDTSSTGDEWLFNAPGDALGTDPQQRLGQAQRDDLRMAMVAVTIGVPLSHFERRESRRLLDGPLVAVQGRLLAVSKGKITLRNHQVMQ